MIAAHIDLYVNDFSLDLGDEGVRAVETLLARAEARGLIPPSELPLFVDLKTRARETRNAKPTQSVAKRRRFKEATSAVETFPAASALVAFLAGCRLLVLDRCFALPTQVHGLDENRFDGFVQPVDDPLLDR